MKQVLLFITLICFVSLQGQQFEEVTNNPMLDYYYSAFDVADVTGDGFQDVFFTGAVDTDGNGNVDTTINEFYKNEEGVFSKVQAFQETAVHLSDVKFIDMDNDGFMDVITTGLSYLDIVNYKHYRYRFNGQDFDLIETLPGRIYGHMNIFDFNHDGKQDYAISGIQYNNGNWDYNLSLYLNDGTDFTEVLDWMDGTQNGDFKVIDLNNDNLLDLIVIGLDSEMNKIFKIYINNGEILELSQSFDGISGTLAYADFDGDGYLDFVVGGSGNNYEPFLAIYRNDGTGNFTEQVFENEDVEAEAIAVGDVNNDGYYDFVIIGDNSNYDGYVKMYVYDRDTDSFEVKLSAETGVYNLGSGGDIQLFDFDNDHHLDLLMSGFDWYSPGYESKTMLFHNLSTEENARPEPPVDLTLEQNGNRFTFSWEGATDDKTPTEALQYELKVGTTSGGQEIMKYVVTTPFWFLDFDSVPETVYWSVKSIDASKVYSVSSEESVLGTDNFEMANAITLYPNPTKDVFYINSDAVIKSAVLYNAMGQKIDLNINNNSVDVSMMASGVYIVKFELDRGISESIRLIIQ